MTHVKMIVVRCDHPETGILKDWCVTDIKGKHFLCHESFIICESVANRINGISDTTVSETDEVAESIIKASEARSNWYPVEIHWLKDDGQEYYFAFLPDFGYSACSAAGDTPQEALENLMEVKYNVIEYYLEKGLTLPNPSNINL